MKRPLAGIALFFILGLVSAYHVRMPCAFLFLPAALSCVCAWLSLRIKFLGTALAWTGIFLLGALLMRQYSVLPHNHIARIKRYVPGHVYRVRGCIVDEPRCKNNRTGFTLRTEDISTRQLRWRCCGNMRVMIKGKPDVAVGQRVEIDGAVGPAYGRYLRGRRIYLLMRVRSTDCVRVQGCAGNGSVRVLIARLKAEIERVLTTRLSPVSASVMAAMLLGEQDQVPQVIYRAMMQTGTVHVLVVSGFNVGIVCFIVVLILKILRIPRRPRFFFCAILLTGYCLLTGASTPVVRATIMCLVFLFAYFIRREEDIYNASCFAAMAILCLNPRNIFDIGFQLSFASVLSIVFFYPRLKKLVRLDGWKNRLAQVIAEGALVSASAWIGTAGLIFLHFRMVSPITVLANLLIVPLATLLTLSGISLLAVERLSPYLASSSAPAIEFLVSLLLHINSFLVNLPGAYFCLPQ